MSSENNLKWIHQKTEARLREIAGRSRGALGLPRQVFESADLAAREMNWGPRSYFRVR